MDSLRDLPPGASYTAKSGQAGLKLEVKNNQLYATATCDSLQQLVFELEEELQQARDSLELSSKESKPAESPFKWYLYGVLTGFLGTVLIYLFIKYKRKWQNIF